MDCLAHFYPFMKKNISCITYTYAWSYAHYDAHIFQTHTIWYTAVGNKLCAMPTSLRWLMCGDKGKGWRGDFGVVVHADTYNITYIQFFLSCNVFFDKHTSPQRCIEHSKTHAHIISPKAWGWGVGLTRKLQERVVFSAAAGQCVLRFARRDVWVHVSVCVLVWRSLECCIINEFI